MSDDYGTATYGTGTYGPAIFATLDDLAMRLGYLTSADFTAKQVAQGTMLLELASGLIRDEAGRSAEWVPIPSSVTLRAVVLEMVARVMTNPTGARSESETLAAYQHSVSYSDGASGLYLTDREMQLVRAAAGGSGRATTMPGTTVDLLVEWRDTGEIAEFPAE